MASKRTVELDLKIQGASTLGEMEQNLAEINEELAKVDVNSEAFKDLSVSAQKANAVLEKTNTQIAGVTSVERAEGAVKLGEGLVGAFQGAAAASAIFGDKTSEAIQEATNKAILLFTAMDGLKKVTEAFSAQNIRAYKSIAEGIGKATAKMIQFARANALVAGVGFAVILGALLLIITYWDDIFGRISKAEEAAEDFGKELDRITEKNDAAAKAIARQTAVNLATLDGQLKVLQASGELTKKQEKELQGLLIKKQKIIGDTANTLRENSNEELTLLKERAEIIDQELIDAERLIVVTKDFNKVAAQGGALGISSSEELNRIGREKFDLDQKGLRAIEDITKEQEKLKEEIEKSEDEYFSFITTIIGAKFEIDALNASQKAALQAQREANREANKYTRITQENNELLQIQGDLYNQLTFLTNEQIDRINIANDDYKDGLLTLEEYTTQLKIINDGLKRQKEIADITAELEQNKVRIDAFGAAIEKNLTKQNRSQEDIDKLLVLQTKSYQEIAKESDNNLKLTKLTTEALEEQADVVDDLAGDDEGGLTGIALIAENIGKQIAAWTDAYNFATNAALIFFRNAVVAADIALKTANEELDLLIEKETEALTDQEALRIELADANGARHLEILDQLNAEDARNAKSNKSKLDALAKIKAAELDLQKARRNQAIAQKKVAVADATIGVALAIIKALTSLSPPFSYIAAGVTAALGAVQVAAIANTPIPPVSQFSQGGHTGEGTNSDVAGIVHANEYVVPAGVLGSQQGASMVAALEGMRTGMRGFADGGFTSVAPVLSEELETTSELQQIIAAIEDANISVSVSEINDVNNNVRVLETKSSL